MVDLYAISQTMGQDRSLIAPDGIHPSAEGYLLWEKQIYPYAQKMLVDVK